MQFNVEIGSDNQWSSKLSYGGRGKEEEERGAAEGLAKGKPKGQVVRIPIDDY